MSEIKAGDLVMVVHIGHSCFEHHRGALFVVERIEHQGGGGWRCKHCRQHNLLPGALRVAYGSAPIPRKLPISWLKRIPPLSELESTEHREGIEA